MNAGNVSIIPNLAETETTRTKHAFSKMPKYVLRKLELWQGEATFNETGVDFEWPSEELLKSLRDHTFLQTIETNRNVKNSCKLASIKGILSTGESSIVFKPKKQDFLFSR